MDVRIAQDWKEILAPEFDKPYFEELIGFVKQEYASRRIFPRGSNIFRAFDKCPLDSLKVVIIGQDPYHGEGQANGLCFSVNDGVPFPPSLRNIFTEINADTGAPIPASGNLDRWAEQGVLLLNAVLTVRAHEAASHAGKGWEQFTDAVVKAISERKEGIVYLLWGQLRTAQRGDCRPDAQPHTQVPAPLALLRQQRLFRLPALLESQRIPRRARQGAGALVIRSLPGTEPESRLRQTGTEGGTIHKPTDTAAGPPFRKAAPLP